MQCTCNSHINLILSQKTISKYFKSETLLNMLSKYSKIKVELNNIGIARKPLNI